MTIFLSVQTTLDLLTDRVRTARLREVFLSRYFSSLVDSILGDRIHWHLLGLLGRQLLPSGSQQL